MPPQQKRSLEEAESFLEGVRVIILDIEGTITPINFVKDTLYSYVTENLESYLTTKYDKDDTQSAITALRDLASSDKKGGVDMSDIPACEDGNKDDVVKAIVANVKLLMDADSKCTELKQLQGQIWKEAYETKQIVGELFEDVNPVLHQLVTQNEDKLRVYIYSSGSVEAQKLLIKYSNEGDLTKLFSGFFDTKIGAKTEAESYRNIKKEIDPEGELDEEEILFLTDNPAEARAACETGLQAVLVDRSIEQEGGIEIDAECRKNFPVIDNLNDLFGEDDDDEEYGQVKRFHAGAEDDDERPDDLDDEDEPEVDDDDDAGVGDDAGDADLGEDEEGEDEEEEA